MGARPPHSCRGRAGPQPRARYVRRRLSDADGFDSAGARRHECWGGVRSVVVVVEQVVERVVAALLHDAVELVRVDLAVAVAVGLVDHVLQLLLRHVLAQLLGHPLQVLERDLARLVVVKEAEGLQDLFPAVLLRHLGGHHLEELVKVDRAGAVLVNVRDHLLDLLLLRLKAQRPHRNLQLLGVNGAGAVGVEKIEGLPDLLFLLLGQLRLAPLALRARRRRSRFSTRGHGR
mmetsp:Transcript_3376/g.5541  ORF Transcript_3376/g.5541 Transcript_3376/m.5541 type:complete len:232 (-) Transcript_3376:4-699(-)